MAEFALVTPLFLALIFGCIDAGFAMYSINAANHTASVGALVLAAEGNQISPQNADQAAITIMSASGINLTALSNVTEYDIYLLNPNGSMVKDAGSCKDTSGAHNPTGCYVRYNLDGTVIAASLNAALANWGPADRNVVNFTSDFLQLDVQYTYRYLYGNTGLLTLHAIRDFRLEPQTG